MAEPSKSMDLDLALDKEANSKGKQPATNTQEQPPSYDSTLSRPQTFNPPDAPQPPPSYNQVCITPLTSTTNLITIAGQNGYHPETGITARLPQNLAVQARQAYKNLLACLRSAGATPRDITFVRHYIVDHADVGYKGSRRENWKNSVVDVVDRGWAPEWMEFMDREGGGHRPPDTVLGVYSLAKPDMVYEVEIQAIVHGGGGWSGVGGAF